MRHSGLGVLYPGTVYRRGAGPERMRRTWDNPNPRCLPNRHDTEPHLNDVADVLASLTVDDRPPWDRTDAFFRRAVIDIEPMTVEQGHLARQAFLDFGNVDTKLE